MDLSDDVQHTGQLLLTGFDRDCIPVEHLDGIDDLDLDGVASACRAGTRRRLSGGP
jgi:hypothetical protein